MSRVVLVSSSPAVRAGLRTLLGAAGDVDVIGEAPSFRPDLAQAFDVPPDVLVLDTGSASALDDVLDGFDDPEVGLLVLGPPDGVGRLLVGQPPFAWGYLSPQSGPEEIGAAIRAVAAGLTVLEPGLLAVLERGTRAATPMAGESREELTAREREILQLVAEGLTNKAIALRLTISDHTVKFHVASILAKLGAGSRTEAVHLAARQGLIAL